MEKEVRQHQGGQEKAAENRLDPARVVAAHREFAADLVRRFGEEIAESGDRRVMLATKEFLEETYGIGEVRQAFNRRSDATGMAAVPFVGPIVHEIRTHYYQLDEVDRVIVLHFKGDLPDPLEVGSAYKIEKTGGVRSVVEMVQKEVAPTPGNAGSQSRGVPRDGMQERPEVRAVESGSPAEPAQIEGGAGSEMHAIGIPRSVQAAALRAANSVIAELRAAAVEEELRVIATNGNGADLAALVSNPEFFDQENEEFTDAGFAEVDRLNQMLAEDRIQMPDAQALDDLNGAHQFAQVEAMEKVLDGLGLDYDRNYSWSTSRYIMVRQGADMPDLKLRFANHLNTARDQPSPDVNVAPGGDGFAEAVEVVASIGRVREQQRPEFPTSETGGAKGAPPAMQRVYINVPFAEKEQAKGLGAKWDKERKSWYVPEKLGPVAAEKHFKKWMDVPQGLSRSDIEKQFHDALVAAGLVVDSAPIVDGKWHRTTVSTSRKTKALKGAYIANLDDEVPNGYIQNFDTGHKAPWFPEGPILTDEQRRQYVRQAAENRAARERELADTQERVAVRCAKKWALLPDVESHPYLDRKGVEAFGLRAQGDNLVTPVHDADGKIWSLQYISANPSRIKLYEKGGQKTGNFHVLGSLAGAETVLFAEGYATCASLHMATQLPIVEVFDSGNIEAVLRALCPRLEGAEKIICADDDTVTQRKVERALNNETIRERFGLAGGIDAGEIETALESREKVPLQANPKCVLQLSYKWPQEHGGFKRVVGEIVNTETNDRLPILINNVGREKAWEAGQKHGAKVVAPVFSAAEAYEVRGLTDFNDLHKDEGLDQVRAQITAVVDLGRAKGIAVEAAKASIGETVTVMEPRDNQRYVGPVVANVGLHAVQDVGHQTAVAHPIAKLDRVPAVGATARIEYAQGCGKVLETPARNGRVNER